MYATVATDKMILEYLDNRLNLPLHILQALQAKISRVNGDKIMYYKFSDELRFKNSETKESIMVHVETWLRNNYTQCRCCGDWYKPNFTAEVLPSSVYVIYSQRLGRDVELPVCPLCTLMDDTGEVLSDCMYAFDSDFVAYNEAFQPITHIFGRSSKNA